MSKTLKINDIVADVREKVYVQDYSPKHSIDGVKVINLKNNIGEDGDFCEILRLNENGEFIEISGFKIAQINRSKLVSGAVKAWHLHFEQDEIWHVMPSSSLVLGLWDVRDDSPTKGIKVKLALGDGASRLVFVPTGVAHGCANVSGKDAELFYFVSNQFNIDNPDERRLPWDAAGSDFWTLPKE